MGGVAVICSPLTTVVPMGHGFDPRLRYYMCLLVKPNKQLSLHVVPEPREPLGPQWCKASVLPQHHAHMPPNVCMATNLLHTFIFLFLVFILTFKLQCTLYMLLAVGLPWLKILKSLANL
jgi:hypothetical protein